MLLLKKQFNKKNIIKVNNLNYCLVLYTFLFFAINGYSQWNQVGNTISPSAQDFYEFGNNVEINSSGNHLAFTSKENIGPGEFNYYLYVYQLINGNWSLKGDPFLLETDSEKLTINSSGDLVAIGMPEFLFNNTPRGRVAIIKWTGNNWEEIDTITGNLPYERLGKYVGYDENNNQFIISAEGYNEDNITKGRVTIYQWNGVQYVETYSIVGNGDGFGGSAVAISINSNIIGVAAWDEDVGSDFGAGRVYIFQWDGNEYNLKGSPIPGTEQLDAFGILLDISSDGNTFAASSKDDIHIFKWNGTIWFQQGDEIQLNDNYTPSLSLAKNGNLISFGNPYYEGGGFGAGRVSVYQWENKNWTQVGLDLLGNIDDKFGYKISITPSGNRLAVYGNEEFKSQPSLGFVKVFENPKLSKEDEKIVSFQILIENPIKDKLKITSFKLIENLQLTLFDVTGKKLKTWKKLVDNSHELNFPYKSGFYVLKIDVNDKTNFSKILIKK